MSTVYFSKRDYREDMHNPTGPARAHAIIRHVSALPSQHGPLYSALYWAICHIQAEYTHSRADYRECFIREYETHVSSPALGFPVWPAFDPSKVWEWAIRKVTPAFYESLTLVSSVLW